LGDGSRVPKNSPRIDALGEVDELNSLLGLLLTETMPDDVRQLLETVQHDLFDLGGEVCIPGYTLLKTEQVERLDAALAHYNAELPSLKEFILPGGTRAAALAHLARTVARRAERGVIGLEAINPPVLQYLNRLSDLLFVLGRYLNRIDGKGDVQWNHERRKTT
jgi:cob(I)alamin adenosyltransferase